MLLEARNVTKNFGGLTAVNSVSLQVAPREIVGLIGPNGAGKTTFLNSISGTFSPTAGEVVFDGQVSTGETAEVMCRKGLARTFQIPRPFPRMTVLENVMVGAVFGANHNSHKSAIIRAQEALEFVRFPLDIHTPANRLNSLQLKRLDLARALACGPKLLLLDELASGLTPGELESMILLIQEIRDTTGVGMIVVEHIMKLITQICDRLVVLVYGTKIVEGLPKEVMNNHQVIEAYLGKEAAASVV